MLSAINWNPCPQSKESAVLVCENNGIGTTIEHLDAERLVFWLKNYKLGEVWRLGEIGGNP
jgi:hypothetical protein